ncbi:MAG: helix-turn-helix domain-containing protein [Oscillochloris sp.]|nr:helix-turn-helix domain-containing protein [Oscillochloris sp.]
MVLLAPSAAPILPDPLPNNLSAPSETTDEPPDTEQAPDDELLIQAPPLPGPTFDPSVLESETARAQFTRNLTAVTAVLAGMGLRAAAERHHLAPSTLARLVQRAKQFGQQAGLPYGTYRRDRAIRPEFQELLRKLYITPLRPTVTAVYEDVRLKQLAEALSAQDGTVVCLPTYRQVWSYLTDIAHEASVSAARSGLKHPPRERMSPASFVLSITAPALIC